MRTRQPEPPGVAVAETHVSVLFFAGDRAYKLLKPITTPFLDYGTTQQRLEAAKRELELNRRLAPDVYLGTADVVEQGEVADRMIVMRRLPAERRLSRLLWSAETSDVIRSVARTIAAFHASLPPLADEAAIAGRDAVRANWEDNHRDIAELVGTVFDRTVHERIVELAGRYLDHHGGLLDQRLAEGFVREGHGDLTAEDIFHLDDGPRIIDCLAFSRKLRVCDVLADIAFLVMDIDRLAGQERSQQLMHCYSEYADEHHPASLAHHYVAYRAHVRAKIEGLRHQQGDESAADRARQYLNLCLDHLERAQLTVVLLGGSPGTGKSTLAEALTGELGYVVLDSDTLRKDLSGKGHDERDDAGLDQGTHSAEVDDATYETLTERAGLLLDSGESVILDASWASATRREQVRQMALERGATMVEIECELPPELARERVAARLGRGGDASDATPDLLDELRARRDPWPGAARLDTSRELQETVSEALAVVTGQRLAFDPSI